jgi:hypothetical protein
MQLVKRIFLVMVVGGLLAACSNGAPRLGHEVALEDSGQLLCSEACSVRGQCGYDANLQEVILAHTGSPATQNHNLILSANQSIAINFSEERQVAPVVSGEPFPLRFYYVTSADGTQVGWVAGWCVAAP